MLRNYPEESVEEDFYLSGETFDPVTIRQAKLSDVAAMLRLINDYASKSVMLPCTEIELCETLRDFLVATEHGRLVGCGRLHFYTPHMAELRSLAVSPNQVRSGLGKRITMELLD